MKGLWLALLGVVMLGGCQQDTIRNVDPDHAAALNARDASFESADDPPFNAATHFAAGQLAESQNRTLQAIEQYELALSKDASHLQAMYRLGVLRAQRREFDAAVAVWQKYVALGGETPDALCNLGFAQELAGRVEQAEASYEKALSRDPRHRASRTNLGLMLARLGREAEAIGQLRWVLSDPEVHYNLGSVYEAQGRYDLARGHFQRALQLEPTFPDAAARLAAIEK